MNTPREKIRYALDRVRDRLPIAVPIVLAKWRVLEDASGRTKTASTNGKEMRYNPEFFEGLNLDEASVIVLHEAAHPLYNHPLRFRLLMARMGVKEGSARWRRLHALHNIAADLAINSLLLPIYKEWNGLSLVSQGCFPRHGPYAGLPEGKSLDYYFAELLKEEEEEDGGGDPGPGGDPEGGRGPEPQKGKGGQRGEGEPEDGEEGDAPPDEPGDGDGDGEGKGEGDGEPGEDEGEGEGDGKGEGEGEAKGDPGSDSTAGDEGEGEGEAEPEPGDGKGKGGKGKTQSEKSMENNVFGEYDAAPIEDATKENEELIADLEEQEREWRRAVAQAVVMDKAIGTGEGDAITESLRDGALVDQPDEAGWIIELQRFLTRYAPGGYTFTRMSRRHAYRRDIIFPEAKARNAGNGLVIVDTSGSMGNGECDRALVEMERVLIRYPNSTIQLISCDTRVYVGEKYHPSDFPITDFEGWKGRGGTDLSPAFRWAKEHKSEYDWCVCVSDMWWSYHDIPDFGLPTFWLHVVPAGLEAQLSYGDVPFGVYHVMPSVAAE